jgi:hypothetical protein
LGSPKRGDPGIIEFLIASPEGGTGLSIWKLQLTFCALFSSRKRFRNEAYYLLDASSRPHE